MAGARSKKKRKVCGNDVAGAAESSSPAPKLLQIEENFRCPISLEVMRDPVVAHGHTFERETIEQCIAQNAGLMRKPLVPSDGVVHSSVSEVRQLVPVH